jgi:hypothetical protein
MLDDVEAGHEQTLQIHTAGLDDFLEKASCQEGSAPVTILLKMGALMILGWTESLPTPPTETARQQTFSTAYF